MKVGGPVCLTGASSSEPVYTQAGLSSTEPGVPPTVPGSYWFLGGKAPVVLLMAAFVGKMMIYYVAPCAAVNLLHDDGLQWPPRSQLDKRPRE